MFGKNSLSLFITANSDEERLNWTRVFALKLSELAGGCTHIPSCNGYWRDEIGELCQELSEFLFAVTDTPDEILAQLRPLLSEYLAAASQSVVLVISGDYPHFYDQDSLN